MKKTVLACLAVLAVAACTMAVSDRPQPNFTYKQYPATPLGVATIQVVEEYNMPSRAPNIEHLMPQPLPRSVSEWARTRFQAAGTDGNLIITIKNAAIVQQELPRTTGVKGWFTVDQSERYEAKLDIEFRLDGTVGGSGGSGTVQVNRGVTAPENTSIQGRDKIWTKMAEDLLTDLDANTQQMLRSRLPFLLK